jgi:hypothetical protein
MRHIALLLSILIGNITFGQIKSQDLIPKDAVTVLSINNLTVLQKVSLDELIQYEFMIDIQQELFDGSAVGKTIKDMGIDFDQKLNVFYGKTFEYEISGFTFGILNKQQLFSVFNDFTKETSNHPGVERYSSYFNQLIIQDNIGLLIRIEPLHEKITELTDSVWYERGNDYYYGAYEDDYMIDNVEESILDVETEEIKEEQKTFGDKDTLTEEVVFDEVRDIVSGKTYWELRDSISFSMQKEYATEVLNSLFSRKESLMKADARFNNQLNTSIADGVFYLDNSRNMEKNQSFWYLRTMLPGLYHELAELYQGNVILGDIFLNETNVEFKFVSNYGEQLGSIYEQLNNAKFDKNTLKYIHKDSPAFFSYNINLRKAYEKAYDVVVSILEKEKDVNVAMNLLALELLDEFIDKDALFNSYKGSMFGSYNGVKKIKTRKIIFEYDEETWEYSEQEVEAEEDMPMFTLGFTTDNPKIIAKVFKRLGRVTSQMEATENYWVLHDAILESAPLYFISKNGLFIVTNDEDLAINHSNGYAKEALSGKRAKEVMKNGFMYAEVDWSKTIDQLPRDMFTGEQNEIIDAMRGKGGHIKLTSSKTTKQNTKFHAVYSFTGEYENSSKYILDFVNSIYMISK